MYRRYGVSLYGTVGSESRIFKLAQLQYCVLHWFSEAFVDTFLLVYPLDTNSIADYLLMCVWYMMVVKTVLWISSGMNKTFIKFKRKRGNNKNMIFLIRTSC